jgi:EmrB/QacA subfamily drug resistance transporter
MSTAAPAAPALLPFDRTSKAFHQRWWTLGVLCLALLIIIVDNSILNVAIPTLVRDLDASNSQLQWMVDSYTLVFAGLLLTAGSLGDRFGRRGALQLGLTIFGVGSLASALVNTPNQLIVTRAFMGIGGAFIMPATLSIITNTFPPEERGRAIGLWAAIAGVATALGPISGGFLIEHFYWGSIFLVNLPIVVVALGASVFVIPTSKDPSKPALDPVGAVLSIIGLMSLVYGFIQAPDSGWTSPNILLAFGFSIIALGAFAIWESYYKSPMLDTSFFKNPRFTAASVGIMLLFFAMFGSIFLLTQYLQFVMGFSALKAGVALLPLALTMLVVAPSSARIVERFGTKLVVGSGLTITGIGLALFATVPSEHISYWGDIAWRLVIMATGMGLTMAPATESIMGSLPRAKAGVGSAMNDTTRQIGGAFGVAIIGSVMSSLYGSRVADAFTQAGVTGQPVEVAKQGLGQALGVAADPRTPSSIVNELVTGAKDAFVYGMHRGVLVGAAAALLGAFIAFRWLPAREDPNSELQNAPAAAPAVGADTQVALETEPVS